MQTGAGGTQESATGRGVWSLLDQAASSLSNYALFIFVARTAGVVGLGAFSVSYFTFAIALGGVRALSSDVLIVRFSNAPRGDRRTAARATTGFALGSGVAIGVVVAGIGLSIGGRVGPPLAALGVILPGLLVQDACRFVFIAAKKPARAFFNDSFWLVTQVVALGALLIHGHPSVVAQMLAWGVAGNVAAAVGLVQLGLLPRPWQGWRWFRQHRDLGLPFGGAFLADRGSSQLGFTLVGATGGLAALGALTAARALFAPATTVLSAAASFSVAEGTRLTGTGVSLRRYSWLVGAAMGMLPLALGGILYFGPSVFGHLLVGRSWAAARTTLIPVAVFSAALAAGLGPQTGLRVLQAAKTYLGTELAIAPASIVAPVVGDILWGVRGAAFGLALSGVIALFLWARIFEIRVRDLPTNDSRTLIRSDPPRRWGRRSRMTSTEGPQQATTVKSTGPGSVDIAKKAEAIFAAFDSTGTGEPHRPQGNTRADPVAAEAAIAPFGLDPVDLAVRLKSIDGRLTAIERTITEILDRLEPARPTTPGRPSVPLARQRNPRKRGGGSR